MGCGGTKPKVAETLFLAMVGLPRSGKSTLAKQLKFIHVGTSAFSVEDLQNFAEETRFNLYKGVLLLIKEMEEQDPDLKTIKNRDNRKYAKEFVTLSFAEFKAQLSEEMGDSLTALWGDKGVKEWVAIHGVEDIDREAQLTYVISQVPRILFPDYVPSEDDCIRARQRTTGLSVVEYTTADPYLHWKLIDMGGQPSERKKWEHGIKDANGVIFCIALDEFDRQSDTSKELNILDEAATLFEEVATSCLSHGKSVFLFLNKNDLFFTKLRKMDKIFEDYDGGKDYECALQYIKDKILAKIDDSKLSQIYVHDSCALDKTKVQTIFSQVMKTVYDSRLKSSGLLEN